MGLCKLDCVAVCDFCSNFKPSIEIIKDGGYDGICKITNKETDRSSGYDCNNFKCFRIKEN